MILNTDGLVQERRNSIVNALELRLSCTNLSIKPFVIDREHISDYEFTIGNPIPHPHGWAIDCQFKVYWR